MNIETLNNAIKEAVRFIEMPHAVTDRAKKDKYIFLGCKETAACKRASLDLTRALSELRKP